MTLDAVPGAPRSKVNDFALKLANVNGTGSSSANNLLMRAIFRMGALDNAFHGRPGRSVKLENPESFVRPEDFSRGDVPSEAPGTAQSLRHDARSGG